MGGRAALGGGAIGLAFLALGIVKLIQGGDWVVWMILGVMFGGLSALRQRKTGGRA